MILVSLILAVLCGLGFGVLYPLGMRLIGIPMDGADGLEAGLLFGVLFFPAILLVFRYQQGRVRKAMEKLPSPPELRCSATLVSGRKRTPMALFLCEDGLYLVDTDKRALPMICCPCTEIIRAASPAPGQLEIHMTENRTLLLRTGAAESLLTAMRDRGWLPFQH